MEEKKVSLEPIMIYRLLVGNMRYAYTRNNHLMPSTAYGEAEELLGKLIEADPQIGLSATKQLLEECIGDEIAGVFYDGLEDRNGNLRESLKFVDYLKDLIRKSGDEAYKPWNQSALDGVIERRKSLRYDLVRMKGDDLTADLLADSAVKENLSEDEAYDELFRLLGAKSFTSSGARDITTGTGKVCGKYMRIMTPESHEGEIYGIILHGGATGKEPEEEGVTRVPQEEK